jgi:hypothetical protein
MKTLGKILALVLVFTFSQSEATDPGKKKTAKKQVTTVKLLPSDAGFIKVLYVSGSSNKVQVSISGYELNFHEKIRLSNSDNGFLKRYDLSDIQQGTYTIKVSDATMSFEFQVEKRANNTLWATYWDAFLPEPESVEPIIASLND